MVNVLSFVSFVSRKRSNSLKKKMITVLRGSGGSGGTGSAIKGSSDSSAGTFVLHHLCMSVQHCLFGTGIGIGTGSSGGGSSGGSTSSSSGGSSSGGSTSSSSSSSSSGGHCRDRDAAKALSVLMVSTGIAIVKSIDRSPAKTKTKTKARSTPAVTPGKKERGPQKLEVSE
jgi:hypothetical protein